LLDAFAVRYVTSTKLLPRGPAHTLRFAPPGESPVYERTRFIPRAYFVGSGARLGPAERRHALKLIASGTPDAPDLRREVLLEGSGPTLRGGGPYTPATVVADRDSSVGVRLTAPSAGYLVLSDTMFPGWRASIDGRRTPIERANGFARAVQVGPGAHAVRFEYHPASFAWGWRVSLLALVLSAGALLVARLRRR
jgi:hypothetical protein